MNPFPGPGVTLVYPYFRCRDPVEKLFPPLGIAYLASQMKERGIPVTVADCTFETFDRVLDRIEGLQPAVIGMSVMVTMSRSAFDLTRELRKRLPGSLFVAGGPLPTVYPALFADRFDAVFCGEGDLSFPRFCHDYLRSGCSRDFLATLDPASYPGLYLKRDGRIRSSPPVHHPSEVLDRLPLPDRSRFDHRAVPGSDGKKYRPETDQPDRHTRMPVFLRFLFKTGLGRPVQETPAREGFFRDRRAYNAGV